LNRFLPLLLIPIISGCAQLQAISGGKTLDLNAALDAAKIAKDTLIVTPKDEEALGREAAANLAAKYKLSGNEAMGRYVSLVGAAVARSAVRKDVTWRFGVLDSAEANAYAAPGGYILVTKGLVALMKDESELAGVLAHEVMHVDRKHALKAMRRGGLLQAGARLSNRTELMAMANGLISMLERGYGKGDELDADKEGTLCLARAGYDATGLVRALQRHDHGGAKDDGFSQRHPPFDDRVKALAKLDVKEGGQKLEARFRSRVKK
jgi:predicted Zn-dependent protease